MRWLTLVVLLIAVPARADGPPGRFPIANGGGTGYLDDQMRPVTAFRYQQAGEYSDGLACVVENGKAFFIDVDGKRLGKQTFTSCTDFSSGVALVTSKKGRQYIDLRGRIVLTPTWKKQPAEDAGSFHDGIAPVRIGAKWGFVDLGGKWVVEPTYGPALDWKAWKLQLKAAAKNADTLLALEGSVDFDAADEMSEARAAVKVGDKWGYIDAAGRMVIQPQWTARPARFSEGRAAVQVGDRALAYIDNLGAISIAGPFEWAGQFSDGLAAVRTADGWRYVDAAGKVVITLDAGVVQANEFHDGLASVAKKLQLRGYIDKAGGWVIAPAFSSAGDFRQGLAPVSKNPTPAWIDKTGKPVWIADDPAGKWADQEPGEHH